MKNSQKVFFVYSVLIIIAILLVVGGVYIYIQNTQENYSEVVGLNTQTTPIIQTSDSQTSGTIYFEYLNTNLVSANDNGLFVTLKIHDNVASTTRELITFSGAKNGVYPASLFSLYRNNIYFVNKTGQLSVVDQNLMQVRNAPVVLRSGEFVSDYLFDGDWLYYLAGPFCNEYKAACDGTLRVFNLKTEKTLDIASHIYKRNIAGFDATHSNLIFSEGFGDAGCQSATFSKLNLSTAAISELPSFSWCEGDKDVDSIVSTKNNFLAGLVPKRTNVNHLQLVQGILQKPVDTIENDDWLTIQVY